MKYAFDRSVRIGWAVVFLAIAIMFLWESTIATIIDHDKAALQRLIDDHNAKHATLAN